MMLLLVLAVPVRTESFLMTREERAKYESRVKALTGRPREAGDVLRGGGSNSSQKPFVRLVASARCKNNCIKWPRTETGLERFSHLARESCNKLARLLQFSQFSLAPSLSSLPSFRAVQEEQQEENQFAARWRCN